MMFTILAISLEDKHLSTDTLAGAENGTQDIIKRLLANRRQTIGKNAKVKSIPI